MSSAEFQPSTLLGFENCTVASGVDASFADALAGGAFAGHKDSVMLLSQNSTAGTNYTLNNSIAPHINEVEMGYILGGEAILSEAFELYLEGLRVS